MGRVEDTFRAAAQKKRKVLVAYLCMGDPTLEESVELCMACVEAGADVLELGAPFSDPTADGPVIQRASIRALASGGGLEAAIRGAALLRAKTGVPLVLFGYYNPIFVRGEERTLSELAKAGADAMLVVDVPFDESLELRARARAQGLCVIPLATPTSNPAYGDSLRGREDAGFLYYVSTTGITGGNTASLSEASKAAGAWSERSGLPAVVGFGVDSGPKARDAASGCAGAVVGSALVKCVEDAPNHAERRSRMQKLIREMRASLDSV